MSDGPELVLAVENVCDVGLVETASYLLLVGEQFRRARFDRRLMSSIENELKIKFVLFKYCFVVRGLVICKQYHSEVS